MFRVARWWPLIVVLGVMLVTGCSRSPGAKVTRYLERGDKYFSKQQYKEAIIEYRNVLRLQATNSHVVRQLGLTHYRLGEWGQGFGWLLKAQALDPNDLEVRLTLGRLYLLGQKPEQARDEAQFILAKEPKHLEGLLLLAGAASTPAEVDTAIKLLDGARADFGNQAKFHLALGTLALRNQDQTSAERSFKEAVVAEPKSIEAHTALGHFYVAKGDVAQAEQAFKTAAELAAVDSPARVQLADFYLLRLGKPDEAKRILREITEKAPHFLLAWRRVAEMALVEQQYDESVKALNVILKKNPSDLDALLLRGRVHLARHETTEAIAKFRAVLKLEPRLAPARYQLALAHLQSGNVQQAKTELQEATTVAPNFAEAILLLAELNLGTGAVQPVIEALETFITQHPNTGQAYILLGSAYLAQQQAVRATDVYSKLVTLAPKDPRGHYFLGVGLRAQGKGTEAKKAFERALALAPGYLEPLTQLVAMAFADKQPDVALQRVKQEVARAPQVAGLQQLLGDVHMRRGEVALAEAAYLKAIEVEPRLVDAYIQLGNLYAASEKYDQALAQADEALKVDPKNLNALMLTAMLHEHKGNFLEAQKTYEQLLALHPRHAAAANNLAVLYSQHGGDQEKALQLARRAKEFAAEEPYIADTLGWILYKRGVYQQALDLFKESAGKMPENAEVQYHLGMAYYKMGDREGARRALTFAANATSSFAGKDEVHKILAELQ